MDIQVLRNFLVLADTLSFSKTANQVYVTQSTLSKQIQILEQELSIQLFHRNKRNVVLTEAGAQFKLEMVKMIDQLDFAINEARLIHNGEAGEIRIGYTHSAMQSFLPAMIRKLNEEFPKLKTVLMEMTNTDQSLALKARDIDLSISPNPVKDFGAKSKLLLRDNFALVLPQGHALNSKNFKGLEEMQGESFILPPKNEGTLYVSVIESLFTDAGFIPKTVHETPYANSGIRLVQGGLGVTIEPIFGLKGYHDLNIIELKNSRQKAELTLMWHEQFEIRHKNILTVIDQFEFNDQSLEF